MIHPFPGDDPNIIIRTFKTSICRTRYKRPRRYGIYQHPFMTVRPFALIIQRSITDTSGIISGHHDPPDTMHNDDPVYSRVPRHYDRTMRVCPDTTDIYSDIRTVPDMTYKHDPHQPYFPVSSRHIRYGPLRIPPDQPFDTFTGSDDHPTYPMIPFPSPVII